MIQGPRLIITTVTMLLGIFAMMTYSSCNKPGYTYEDECAGVVCNNNGVCIDGGCDCTNGFTGTNCDERIITPFLGRWNFTQTIMASKRQENIGTKKSYEVQITEDAQAVTSLQMKGFMGNVGNTATLQAGMAIGYETINSIITETDVIAHQYSFVFKRYQPVGQSGIQVLKGEGSINELGTQMTGEFYIIYPDAQYGALEEHVAFSASYIK